MQLVDDAPCLPAADARALGDAVLRGALVLAAAVLAALSLARAGALERSPASEPAPRLPLPVVAPAAMDAASWDGFERGPEGGLVLRTYAEDERVATLPGGAGWRDYVVRAKLKAVRGDAAVLVRLASEGDFVACALRGRRLAIERVEQGVRATLAAAPLAPARGRDLDVVVRVRAGRVTAAVDGTPLVTAVTGDKPARGGVGFSVSDPAWGRGRLEVSHVAVEPFSPGPDVPAHAPLAPPVTDVTGSGE